MYSSYLYDEFNGKLLMKNKFVYYIQLFTLDGKLGKIVDYIFCCYSICSNYFYNSSINIRNEKPEEEKCSW